MDKKRIIRIGFDLDGVFIDKPPLIPGKVIEWLYRSHSNRQLSYRYPKTRLERLIRRISHYYKFRPPIKQNLDFIKKLSKDEGYELYVISGRYAFLEKRTQIWFKINGLDRTFREVNINLKNEQPHVFKEKMLKKLKPDIYFEDDELIAKYLARKLAKRGLKIYHIKFKSNLSFWFK
ncbi:hypothetical protein A3D00_00335 [Candidatus Woesebacteria bacterium RIFCSPHIGHO2_02_FULL_38_9]|uniref:FCP1 homology domain-containing protein n=1 Tax=Candidatus Woesebacteria bacterium RIFCSPHIGHO2_01_FULL_39_28 TaxID=1802496 RepID=A0A1F7YLC4_9BACT|nr:MAG: hypothetical protein A2627_04590 [Candidatus Woesebacteria bacterium RIFCSPHIGHO2_01_FULL_39_28]OGM33180.1 MAG: hypothetical protein A3D00_00335 [Candidatus Woesebacteria bacterium RIFCSPHIGHO2_02_FULL_38_9]